MFAEQTASGGYRKHTKPHATKSAKEKLGEKDDQPTQPKGETPLHPYYSDQGVSGGSGPSSLPKGISPETSLVNDRCVIMVHIQRKKLEWK